MIESLLSSKQIIKPPFDLLTEPLLLGTASDGWYGEVKVTDMITGPALATAVGLTAGTAMPTNANFPWLHFTLAGKHLLVAKRCYRTNMTWDDMNALGIVFGTKTITLGPYTYKVRLIKGAPNGEWDKLMYRVSNAGMVSPLWASYTDDDLGLAGVTYVRGSTLCQDIHSTVYVYERGNASIGSGPTVARSRGMDKNIASTLIAWRPVLELIP